MGLFSANNETKFGPFQTTNLRVEIWAKANLCYGETNYYSNIEDKRKIELLHEIVVLRANMAVSTFLTSRIEVNSAHRHLLFIEYSSKRRRRAALPLMATRLCLINLGTRNEVCL